ncbi:MAG: enoyl-CoA hydratase-related protein [Rhodospirillales bacterium]|nr:enoyl-CoA hydratase-related protein [Rhodospirillales bacterium]
MTQHSYGNYEKIKLTINDRPQGRVAFVSIDNKKKANSVSPVVIKNLHQVFFDLSHDSQLRAVVLGDPKEKGFCAGADITAMENLTPESGRTFISSLHDAINQIRNLPVPVIGCLKGYSFGAGLEIAAACDFRAGDSNLVIGMPEVKVGIPSVIEAALLPMLIGWGKAREMLLTGANYTAEEAYQMGFLQKLTAPEDLNQEIEAWLDHILESGPLAVRSQKSLMAKWEKLSLDDAITEGISQFGKSYETDEPKKMMAARLK